MRVLLVPPKNNYPLPNPSVDIFGQGFPYIAGALKKAGHEVFGVNMIYQWCHDSAPVALAKLLRKAIEEYQPNLIGVGGLSGDYSFIRDAIYTIRRIAPDIPIVCGGGIVTYDQHYIFTNLRPDFAVYGEGETTIVALADYLERGGDICNIPNIAYWKNDEPVYTKIEYINAELDTIAWPDYSPFDFEAFIERSNQADNIVYGHTRQHPRVMPITLGRSCPFGCTFCVHAPGQKYRQRSIDNAIEEVVYYYDKYNFNILFIYDELFSVRAERVIEFCTKVKELKADLGIDFDWTCDLRVTHVDRDMLTEMKDAGCIFIGYGFESASPEVLKSMKKQIKVDQIERAIQLTKEVGIGVQANFIFGDIAETQETIQETMDFFDKWCADSMVHLNYIAPYPGSEIFQYCIDSGLIKNKQQYYNQIGWIGKYKINMTEMSDDIFFGIINNIVKITDPSVHDMLGLKEGNVILCEEAGPYEFDFHAPLSLRRSLYKIKVICPNCRGTVDYLYPLRIVMPYNPHLLRLYCAKCHTRFNIKIPEENETLQKQSDQPDLFSAGNYTTVAMTGSLDQWQTYAAMGLIGKTQVGIEGLSRFSHLEARFYLAVAYWIDGDEAAAVRILERIPTPHAQNLLALIRKPQIRILAQLPWTRKPPHDLLTAAEKDKKFKVQNISFHQDDLSNEPYADIFKFYDPDIPPDFYVCAMAEWHLIPPNLQQLPCPIIGQTADYDLHVQAVYPWLQIFDEMVVTDHAEWEDVRRLVSSPVSTFPKSFGVSDTLPPIPPGPRPVDVFSSGTMTHPYNPDKASLLHQLFRMPDIKSRCIEGFMIPGVYQQVLANTKVNFTYVRHPGSLPTRGLEALSMGCAVVVQKGSVLTLFVGGEDGVLTYDYDAGNLADAIARILNQWPEFARRARKGADIIRREFGMQRVASQYFRFLTFLAAKPRPQREIQLMAQLDQKRTVLCKGWLPGGPDVLQKIRKANIDKWQTRLKEEEPPRFIIDMARELVLEYATAVSGANGPLADKRLLDQALALYRDGFARFPQSLVLRFNLIRVALHFGQAQDISEALQLAEESLMMPVSSWHIDVIEDVFPWDFYNTFFNYRRYFDVITEHMVQRTPITEILIQLILASLYHYLGQHSENIDHLKQAVSLDPDFPYYKMSYALGLLKREKPEDYAEAGELLTQLAENSILFNNAFRLLEHLQAKELFVSPKFEELERTVNRARQSIRLHDWRRPFELQPIEITPTATSEPQNVAPATKSSGGHAGINRNQARSSVSQKEYLVSALVPTYNAERFMRGLLEDLESQTISDRLEIVIVDSKSPQNERAIVEEFQQQYDNIVYVRTDDWENSHAGINRCIRLARGKYVTLACTDDRHKPDAFERMVAVLETRHDIALVYANSYITMFENETFDNCTPIGSYRWANFDPLQLLYGCYIGPQPMWRKSLHEMHGYFDEELEQAGDWEFWLRLAAHETFLHIDEFLGLYLYSPSGRQYRDPELTQREALIVQERYLHREAELKEKKRGTLVLVVKGEGPNEQMVRCVEQLQFSSPASRDLSIKVVRAHSGLPENDLEVNVSPKTSTALDALNQGALREARYIILVSPDVHITKDCINRLVAVADSDPSIAAVGPVSNTALGPQRVEHTTGNTEDEFGTYAARFSKEFGDKCEEVPFLGGFCVLFKAEAVRQVGGFQNSHSLPLSLWDMYARLRASGYKLACARGVYVHRTTLTSKEGPEFDVREEKLSEGEALSHEGRFKEAEEIFREVLKDCPTHPKARNDLACLLWLTGRAEDALGELTKAIETAPDDRDVIWNCGQILIELGFPEDALKVYRDFLQRHPDDFEVREVVENIEKRPVRNETTAGDTKTLIEKGEELFGKGRIDTARKIFKEILAKDPQLVEPLNNLGVIAFQQGEIDEAISYFTRVLEIDPDYFEAIENLGKCMEAKKDYAGGIKWFKRAVELRPDDLSLLNSLGNCYIQTEDFASAREVYEKSLGLDNGQASVAMILREMGRLEEAVFVTI